MNKSLHKLLPVLFGFFVMGFCDVVGTDYQMFYFVLFICSVIGMVLVFFFKVPTNKDLKVFH